MPKAKPFTETYTDRTGREREIEIELSDKEDMRYFIPRGNDGHHFKTKEAVRDFLERVASF